MTKFLKNLPERFPRYCFPSVRAPAVTVPPSGIIRFLCKAGFK
ncbi:hypothetical protein HMPREF1548_04239 [Clostridium sp. KLE 1755]|nr:hypothetical protein HMPREF1548_04239 [Clostridium sp. KLE 1755]